MKSMLSEHAREAYLRYAQVGKSVCLKITGAFVAFLWQLITYRALGAAAGGLLAIFQSELRLAGTLAAIGLDREMTLVLPKAPASGSDEQRRELIEGALIIGITFGLIGAVIVATIVHFCDGYVVSPLLITTGVLSFTLLVILAGALRGLQMPLVADIQFTIAPMLISSIGFSILIACKSASIRNAASILVLGQVVVVSVACLLLSKAARIETNYRIFSVEPKKIGRLIRGVNLPLAICSSASTLFPDLILVTVGYLSSSTSAAAFGVAVRYIRLARFVPVSFLHVKEPKLAALTNSDDGEHLKTEVRIASIGSFLISLIILGILAVCSNWLMEIFGRDFASLTPVFYIVIVAELVNSTALMSPSVMLMNNRAFDMAIIYITSYAAGLIFAVLASDRLGGVGAACGLLLANLILAIWSAFACRRETRVKADVIPGMWFIGKLKRPE